VTARGAAAIRRMNSCCPDGSPALPLEVRATMPINDINREQLLLFLSARVLRGAVYHSLWSVGVHLDLDGVVELRDGSTIGLRFHGGY
jgi:hypothetical protein